MSARSLDSIRAVHWTVVGAGSIGRRHLTNLRALGAPAPTVVRREAAPLDGDLADVPVVTRLEPAAHDRSAVIICTPTAQHAEDTTTALAAGYHVLLEKPIAATAADATTILDAETQSGRVVMIASCLRFHPVVQQVRQLVQSGELGPVHWAAIWCGQHLADWQPGRDYRHTYRARLADGGGVLLDLIHEIDYLHWIWGDAALVAAHLGDGQRLDIQADETADLVLRLSGAGLATCHLDYLMRPITRGGRLAALHGSARWDLIDQTFELWRDTDPCWRAVPMPAGWMVNQMYCDEIAAFADCVVLGAANPSPTADGARALATAMSARARAERVAP